MSVEEGRVKGGNLFTSESVTEGHPDQICAKITEACIDAILAEDPKARMGIEAACCKDFVLLMGEVSTTANPDYEVIVRDTIKDIGYTKPEEGFSYDTVEILNKITTQSPDIAMGVDNEGAGDQGMMFGGATNETPERMPLAITMARELTKCLSDLSLQEDAILRPDGKAQVTVRYSKAGAPVGIDTIVVSCMHKDMPIEKVRHYIKTRVIAPVISQFGYSLSDINNIHINPTGRFVNGGPAADSGLNGRKIIVDTYGGYFSHGGGALAGKDATKVDRSGAFMARYIAKNIVAAGLADKCEIQLSYAIGVVKPVSVNIRCYGTNKMPISLIAKAVYANFDMTPKGISDTFHLTEPTWRYADMQYYGYFGRRAGSAGCVPWEREDKAEALSTFCEENYTVEPKYSK